MIRHLLKLVWNRKRTNGLIILEIFLSFLVVFLVVTVGLTNLRSFTDPLGFSYDDVWTVSLSTDNRRDWIIEQVPTLERLREELETLTEVEAVTAANGLPYDGNQDNYGADHEGRTVYTQHSVATAGFHDVFHLDLVAGRWFDESDLAQAWSAAVIDEGLALELFDRLDVLGEKLPMGRAEERRVVGVVSDYRKDGEMGRAERDSHMFEQYRPDLDAGAFLTNFAIRLQPGTPAAFEEQLVRRVQAIAPEWTAEVRALDLTRRHELRMRLAPMIAVGIVAGFLLAMVGLGLVGVLWQNVTQRTKEIGLRRAAGATRGTIHRQILIELVLIASIGLAIGAITVVQFPILELWDFMTFDVFAIGLGISLVTIYGLTLLCGFYPSFMATRVEPAEALHYE